MYRMPLHYNVSGTRTVVEWIQPLAFHVIGRLVVAVAAEDRLCVSDSNGNNPACCSSSLPNAATVASQHRY